jgi:hypothetical protein
MSPGAPVNVVLDKKPQRPDKRIVFVIIGHPHCGTPFTHFEPISYGVRVVVSSSVVVTQEQVSVHGALPHEAPLLLRHHLTCMHSAGSTGTIT